MSVNSLFELTNNDFNNDTTLRKYKKSIVIILFYMTGCHWCDLCKPDFIKAATIGMNKVRFSMIDISKPDGQALKEKLNSVRNPKLPEVKTLKEQGYSVPTIYYFTMASNQMSTSKQKQLGTILDQAMTAIGRDKIFEMIDLSVPLISGEQHYYQTYDMFTSLIQKYKSKIENAQ